MIYLSLSFPSKILSLTKVENYLVSKQPGTITLPLSPADTPLTPGPLTSFLALSKSLTSHYLDLKFLSPPQQCGDPIACENLKKDFEWDEWMSVEEQNLSKYILDVDGNGWSGRFHRSVLLPLPFFFPPAPASDGW